jgi:UDP-N-acetylglucosamine 2-epimerase (non-hydrolysing)
LIRAVNVVGARPNFMKVAPIHRAMRDAGGFEPLLVHTGQHYDREMSEVFFDELGLPQPDVSLGVGSGSHAEQTAGVMLALEPVLRGRRPDVVVVVGDVNSTLAAALTAAKLSIPVAHVEAGLRSFDRSMPEELNRVVADVLSDVHFAPSRDAVENLRNEGIPAERIHLVGNVMIDSLLACRERARSSTVLDRLGVDPGAYFLATVHRPSNVDAPQDLRRVADILTRVGALLPVILAAHPRTANVLAAAGLGPELERGGVRIIGPLGYLDFLQLMAESAAVLTDSGGIQEETTVLGVPCITLRDRTERPITVTEGTNTVTGLDANAVLLAAGFALDGRPTARRPELWDGRAAVRIVRVLAQWFEPAP